MRRKKFYLCDSKVLGVCGGLARYFDIDAFLIRCVFVILLFVPYIPIVIPYLILGLFANEGE